MTSGFAQSAAPSWGDAIARFESSLLAAGRKDSTVRQRVTVATRFSREFPEGPTTVTATRAVRYFRDRGWSDATWNAQLSGLRSFFGWAVHEGLIASNPIDAIQRKSPRPRQSVPPSWDRINAVAAEQSEDWSLAIRLIASAGLKVSEIARLRGRDVNYRDGVFLLSSADGQDVVLPASLGREIKRRGAGWTFPGKTGGHIAAGSVTKRVSSAFSGEVTTEVLRSAASRQPPAGFHDPGGWRVRSVAEMIADGRVLSSHLRRIERDIETDPAAAISESKDLVEAVLRHLLIEAGAPSKPGTRLPQLAEAVAESLGLANRSVPDSEHASQGATAVTHGIVGTIGGLATLRNAVGTGHGRADARTAEPRHARLAFNAAIAVTEFLAETWRAAKSDIEL